MFPGWGRLSLLPHPLPSQVQVPAPELVVFGTKISQKWAFSQLFLCFTFPHWSHLGN